MSNKMLELLESIEEGIVKDNYEADEITSVGIGDAELDPDFEFDDVGLINTGDTKLTFSIDTSTSTAGKRIILPAGAYFNKKLSGSKLHYKSDVPGGSFAYYLGEMVP